MTVMIATTMAMVMMMTSMLIIVSIIMIVRHSAELWGPSAAASDCSVLEADGAESMRFAKYVPPLFV